MKKAKSYSILEVCNWADIGIIWEFYSTKESAFIVSDLSKCTSKNIILTNETIYHPSYSNAILIREYEATKSRYQFHIAPQNYHSILPLIDSVTTWIAESAETSHDTQLKISLSFNHRHLDTLSSISNMNPSRLILKFDENFVYSRFPEQQKSPYALSIKKLATPVSNYINETEIEKNINYILTTPQSEYYGINFSNYTRGILECNYIGGRDYASKAKEIKEILEYFIIKSYQSLNEEDHDEFEKYEIKKMGARFSKIQMAYYDPEIFINEYKDLKIYVDLKTSDQIIKTFWNTLRKPLFEMILNGNLQKGIINYDADLGIFQLKKTKIQGTYLKNVDFVNCEVSGIFESCTFISTEITNSRIYNSKFIKGNKIINSYLEGASVNKENEITKCYVINEEEIINCPIKESVIKFATPGKNITLDEHSTIVVTQMPLSKKTDAIQVEELRDYAWIKEMNKSEDKGYQNAYDRNKYLKK
jgi:hypothetical protein